MDNKPSARQTQQTAIIQSRDGGDLPISISNLVPVPAPASPTHVLIRVLTVALNPIDFKMVTHFPQPGTNIAIGCDFCGIVEDGSDAALAMFPLGSRVCGGVFPYGCADADASRKDGVSGAFAEWLVADASRLLRVPDGWDDLQSAAVGGVCWGTCVLALFADPDALTLPGSPSEPADENMPVLVYGGATATGTMACQLLKASGYSPVAVTSSGSAPLARAYGAVATAAYTSPTCVEIIRSLAQPEPIRHVLDCITTQDSAAICFAAIGRAGGRYACLEKFEDEWRTRRAVRTKEVMGFEGIGRLVVLGDHTYTRMQNMDLYHRWNAWAAQMQALLDKGLIQSHPVRELPGRHEGIVEGLLMLQRGEVRGQKLVVRLAAL